MAFLSKRFGGNQITVFMGWLCSMGWMLVVMWSKEDTNGICWYAFHAGIFASH